MWLIPEKTADLVTFTEKILTSKLNFLCSVFHFFFDLYQVKEVQKFPYSYSQLKNSQVNTRLFMIFKEEKIHSDIQRPGLWWLIVAKLNFNHQRNF